jgi:hypothetical protein
MCDAVNLIILIIISPSTWVSEVNRFTLYAGVIDAGVTRRG